MSLINYAYEAVQSILNKNSRGVISPERFNLFVRNAQNEIFSNLNNKYRAALNKKRGGRAVNINVGDLETQLAKYLVSINPTIIAGEIDIPTDFAFFPETFLFYSGQEVSEIPMDQYNYYISGIVAPSVNYPQVKVFQNKLKIFPNTISSNVEMHYFRQPKTPKWTYTLVGGQALFNSSAGDYQDLDVYEHRLTDIITGVLELAGVHIRDQIVVQVSEALKQAGYVKDNQS